MQEPRATARPIKWLPASEAALLLVADIIMVLVLQRSQVLEVTGVALGWWALAAPAVLACVLASWSARKLGATALPCGPNAVFVMAFAGVFTSFGHQMCPSAGGGELCLDEVGGFFGAALTVYAVMLGLLTFVALRLDLQGYRRVMLMPLAAICWVYLVIAPALRLTREPVALAVPAVLLCVLLVAGLGKFIPWLITGLTWLVLAWMTDSFPSASAVTSSVLPPFAFGSALRWLMRSELWLEALPIMLPLAIANAFGIIENLAAVREVGDPASPSHTLATVTLGTLSAAALGTSAPTTVFVGHAAFHRRGAGWAYCLLAVPLLLAIGMFGDGLVGRLPTPIFLGAIAYLGIAVGTLPRHHLNGMRDVARFALVALPVVVRGLIEAHHPVLVWIGRGGGLTAVGWSFLVFAPVEARQRAAVAMAVASVLGLTHAPPFSAPGAVTALAYVLLAAVLPKLAR